MRLRKKKLEMILSRLSPHPNPDPRLEQYELSPKSAARMIIWAWEKGDIEGRRVCDLGCGTGILTVSAALCGAISVCGIDLDPVALKIARENINIAEESSGLEVSNRVELKRIDVTKIDLQGAGTFDTVVQNPPFGVQRRSSDRVFIRKALELAPTAYSLHKRNIDVDRFIRTYVDQQGGVVQDKIEIDLPIRHTFGFHRKPSYVVSADLFMIRRRNVDAKEA